MRLIPELSIDREDVATYIHVYEEATLFITTTNGLISLITVQNITENEYVELFFDIYKGECYYMCLNEKTFDGNIDYINKLYLELTAELSSKT